LLLTESGVAAVLSALPTIAAHPTAPQTSTVKARPTPISQFRSRWFFIGGASYI
jgi:hypothetical protein